MMIFNDEVKVRVLSALGQQTGEFIWPKKCWPLLQKLNESTEGYYFRKVTPTKSETPKKLKIK